MSIPDSVQCHLVEDLLIPYAAGDVSDVTRAWMESHLAGCSRCQAARDQLAGAAARHAAPAPAPPEDPGRRLIGRVRRHVLLLVGALVLALAVGAGALIWAISSVHRWANMPAHHPVPPDGMTPAAAVQVDLSSAGLAPADAGAVDNGAFALYRDGAGHGVRIEARRFDSARAAEAAFASWYGGFRTYMASVRLTGDGQDLVKFRNGGHYYYAWQRADWVIIIQVSGDAADPAALRDQVRDQLFASFGR